MENQQTKGERTDEVSITEVFRWVGRGFRRIGDGLIGGVAGLRSTFIRNRIFFSILIVMGLIAGALYSEILRKENYKASMIISCAYLNNELLEKSIDKLNLLTEEGDREGLARELKIDVDLAKNIHEFEFNPFMATEQVIEMELLKEQLGNIEAENIGLVEKIMDKLQVVNQTAFEINVFVYDPESIKDLEKSVFTYFQSNDYIKRRLEISKIIMNNRKIKLLKESKTLDSLEVVLLQNYIQMTQRTRGSNNVILGEEKLTNPLEILAKDLELFQAVLDIDEYLYVNPDFELVDGFTTIKVPATLTLAQILFLSVLISIFAGYVILALIEFNRTLAALSTRM